MGVFDDFRALTSNGSDDLVLPESVLGCLCTFSAVFGFFLVLAAPLLEPVFVFLEPIFLSDLLTGLLSLPPPLAVGSDLDFSTPGNELFVFNDVLELALRVVGLEYL